MDIKIRQVTIHDLNRVANIEELCFPKAEAATTASLEDRIRVFPESFLVAVLDGNIVGFINGSVINEKIIKDKFYDDTSFHDSMGDYQSIFGLDVLPEFRAKGIAAELIKKLIEVAKKADRKGMTLCCKDEKIHYYEKFGFFNIGRSQSEHGHAVWNDMILLFNE